MRNKKEKGYRISEPGDVVTVAVEFPRQPSNAYLVVPEGKALDGTVYGGRGWYTTEIATTRDGMAQILADISLTEFNDWQHSRGMRAFSAPYVFRKHVEKLTGTPEETRSVIDWANEKVYTFPTRREYGDFLDALEALDAAWLAIPDSDKPTIDGKMIGRLDWQKAVEACAVLQAMADVALAKRDIRTTDENGKANKASK